MPTLIEILTEYGQVMAALDEAEGVVEDDIAARLSACEGDLHDKVERIEHLVESLAAKAKSVRSRVAALETHARACENRARNLREWVTGELEAAGLDRYETDSFSLKRQKSPPRLDIKDEAALWAFARQYHPEWIRVEEKIDKKAALDAAKSEGGELPGVEVVRGLHWRVS